jgi:lauroyl/myristoyl acyltransferase
MYASLQTFLKNLLGRICVLAIVIVKRVPPSFTFLLFSLLLPLYSVLRRSHINRVKHRIGSSPFKGTLSIKEYYRTRLKLLLHSIKFHDPYTLPKNLIVRNAGLFTSALDSGKPILLCGLHMGLFELLHKVPWTEASRRNKSFIVLTSPAFSPVLTAYLNKGRILPDKKVELNRSLFRTVRRTLKLSGVLAVMIDQSPFRGGEYVTLWKKIKVPFNKNLFRVMAGQEAIAVPVSTHINSTGTVVVEYHPPLNPPEDTAFDPSQWKEEVRCFLEQEIARAPAQWNWSYPGIDLH